MKNRSALPLPAGLRSCRWALLLGLALLATPALAQQPTAPADSSRISYGEETMPEPLSPPTTALGQGYSKLTRLQVEERELFKIGLNNFGFGGSYYESRTGLHLAYERKLAPAWSVMGEVSPDIFRYRPDTTRDDRSTKYSARVQVAGRYYYNLNQRIRRGKSASNFSANYLGLGLGAGLGRFSRLSPFYNYNRSGRAVRAVAMVQYGLQRRLGEYGFVDFNVGIPFLLTNDRDDDGDMLTGAQFVRLNLRIGLAFGR
jgi:hypothetical protein